MRPKVYRPVIPSTYVEPEGLPDPSEGLECLYQPLGHSLWKERIPPGKQADIIRFQQKDEAQLKRNINWTGCKEEYKHHLVTPTIKEYWDVFAKEGLRNPIWGFQFVVDTGAARPICCKLPRYGMHEGPVIKKICDGF